jgi:hypothetical protein
MQVMAGLIPRVAVAAAVIVGGLSFTATAKADDPPNEQEFIKAISSLPMCVTDGDFPKSCERSLRPDRWMVTIPAALGSLRLGANRRNC